MKIMIYKPNNWRTNVALVLRTYKENVSKNVVKEFANCILLEAWTSSASAGKLGEL